MLQALSARIESSGLFAPSGGFLNRQEFFIILAGLQKHLGLNDELFQEKIFKYAEGVPRRQDSFAGDVFEDDVQKTFAPPAYSSIIEEARQDGARERIVSPFSDDQSPETVVNGTQVYADGFTEYSAAFYVPKPPAVEKKGDESSAAVKIYDAGKLPTRQYESESLIGSPINWVCPTCTIPNSIKLLACQVCTTGHPSPQYTDLIDASNGTSSINQLTIVNPQDSFKVVTAASKEPENKIEAAEKEVRRFSGTLPEVLPTREKKSDLLPTPNIRLDARTSAYQPSHGIYEMGTSITTSASDAEARSLVMALEPKKRMFSVKGFRRNIQSSDNEDQATSGFSLQSLAQVLETAAAAGNLSLVASTLDLGVDVNYSSRKNKQYHLALQRAALGKHEDVVDYLLGMGANRDTCASALYSAINHKATGIARKLVPRADINKMWRSTRLGDTPCYESCISALVALDRGSRQKLLRLMMDQPVFDAEGPALAFVEKMDDLSSPKSCGMTVLACFTQFTDLADVEFLLQELGETYCIPKRSNSSQYRDPLCCIGRDYWEQNSTDALRLAELLIKHGAQAGATVSIPGQRKNEYSTLTAAIKAGSLEGVQLLLKHGANPESPMYVVENHPHDHLSPLSYAVLCRENDICRSLVASGALPTRANADGTTPLYFACLGGILELITYLLSFNVKHNDVHKCLEAAVESNNPEIVRMLIEVGATSTPQVWDQAMSTKRTGARQNHYIAIIDLLLSTKTKTKIFPRAAILTAIDYKNFSGLSRVLEMRNGNLGFDVNEVFQDPRWSNVPFMVQASTFTTWSGNRDVEIKRDDSYTCLAYAEERGSDEIVTLLKSYGWMSKKRCGPECEARFGSKYDCDGNPPHTRRVPRPYMDGKEVTRVRAGH